MNGKKELLMDWKEHDMTKYFFKLVQEKKEYELSLLMNLEPIDSVQCAKHIATINFITNFLDNIDTFILD